MASIYLSSTFKDLAPHREAAYRALRKMRQDVVSMENYSASARPPVEKCVADVEGCAVYVGILAFRYGYVPPQQTRSITEIELRTAQKSGKLCLLFLLADDAPMDPGLIDTDRSAIDALRADVERDHVVQYFRTPDELAVAVSVAVANTLAEAAAGSAAEALRAPSQADPASQRFYRQSLERFTHELGSQIRFYQLGSATLSIFGTALLAGGFFAGQLPIILGGALVDSTTAFPLATMLSCRRKKVLLDTYELELRNEPPAREALDAVQRFLASQMKVQGLG